MAHSLPRSSRSNSQASLYDHVGRPAVEDADDAAWIEALDDRRLRRKPNNHRSKIVPHDCIVVKSMAVGATRLDLQKRGSAKGKFLSWKKYPCILGSNGIVAKVGPHTGQGEGPFKPNDRVVGHAQGMSNHKSDDHSEGAFQRHVRLRNHMTSKVPDHIPFERVASIPLALSTAACALFMKKHLNLPFPSSANASDAAKESDEESGKEKSGERRTVLIWGARSSVGRNAAQLAMAAGFDVLAVAGASVDIHGATQVVAYAEKPELRQQLRNRQLKLAGVVAIGDTAAQDCMQALKDYHGGKKKIAIVSSPSPPEEYSVVRYKASKVFSQLSVKASSWMKHSCVSYVDSGSLANDKQLANQLYREWLPQALAQGEENGYVPMPEAHLLPGPICMLNAALEHIAKQPMGAGEEWLNKGKPVVRLNELN